MKPTDLADPIFAGTEAKLSFHIQNEMVSAISVLIPASQITNIADRIKTNYGAWIPVQSPIAQKKNKQSVALLWDFGTSRLIFDFEATESGEYLLLALPIQKR